MALTAEQLSALASHAAVAKIAVNFGSFYFCSGQDYVQVGADWYEPRPMRGSVLALGSPASSRTAVSVDDSDSSIETAWYSSTFSGSDVSVYILLREIGSSEWVTVSSVLWGCEKCAVGGGEFVLDLYAALGRRKRAGLSVGTLSAFPRAPREGETFTFGGNGTTVRRVEDHVLSGGTVGSSGYTSSSAWLRQWKIDHKIK